MFRDQDSTVSEISGYSLFAYFLFVLVGFVIEFFVFSQKVFSSDFSLYLGLGLMALSTVVIIWAGHTGSQYRKQGHRYDELEHVHLKKGAFRFTRNPHYLGLGLLVLGFGVVTNSLAILVLAGLAFMAVNSWFIPREELILSKRHGQHFEDYKKTTRRWF